MKASVYIATSLDGYIAREGGALDWLPGSGGEVQEGGSDYGYQAFFDSVDVLVMGRNTFETVLSFGQWPYGQKRVVVLSSSLGHLPQEMPETVELRSASPAELWSELQASGARHLYVDGGKTIQGFLNAGLIDELIITTIPVLIGRGIPLFGDLAQDVRLQHLGTEAFESGLVQSKYGVIK
jgi:dihydrofolate reductase